MHYWVNVLFSVSNKESPFPHEGKRTETPPRGPPESWGGLGQQPDSSVEVDSVMGVGNHLSQVGGIIFCGKKCAQKINK